jgi:hypothetical protein
MGNQKHSIYELNIASPKHERTARRKHHQTPSGSQNTLHFGLPSPDWLDRIIPDRSITMIIAPRQSTPTVNNIPDMNPFDKGSYQERIFDEVLEELNTERAENWKLREQLAEKDEQIATLEDQLDHSEKQRTQQYMHYAGIMEWIQKLFHNATIPAACKLVLFYFYLTHGSFTGREMRIGVEEAAKAIGMSTSTVRKATDKFQSYDILKRRYEPVTTDSGDKITLVHIALEDAIKNPDKIEMENNHGGQRAKVCHKPDCRSNNVDRYTLQYCRDCAGTEWYGQPGLRNDADVEEAKKSIAVDYVGKHPHLSKDATTSSPGPDNIQNEKQDAFEIDLESQRYNAAVDLITNLITHGLELEYLPNGQRRLNHVGNSTSTATEIAHLKTQIKEYDSEIRSMRADIQTAQAEKQDAFTPQVEEFSQANQLATQPNITETRQVEYTPPTVTCHAQVPVGKFKQPVKALEKVKGWTECGSTRWMWHEAERIHVCAECWAPLPTPAF